MNDQTQSPLEGTFHLLSRVIMVVPIAIIATALILRTGNRSTNASSTLSQISPTYAPVAARVPTNPPVNPVNSGGSSAKLDLNSSQVCSYSTPDMQAQISIKNKKIFSQLTQKSGVENVLVNGDCVYKWSTGSSTGEKSCGVGQMISMADSLSQFGLLDMNTVIQTITQMNNTISITPPASVDLDNICTKTEVADSVFAVPSGVTFQASSVNKMDFSQ